MTEKHEVEEEMSMEEILSSIRKYVIDEKPTYAKTSGGKDSEIRSQINSPEVQRPRVAGSSMNTANLEYQDRNEDVIELTNPLEESQAPRTPSIATSITSAHDEVLISTPAAPATAASVTPILAATPSKVVAPSAPQQSIQVNNPLRSHPLRPSGFEGQESFERQALQQMPFQASQQRYPFYRSQPPYATSPKLEELRAAAAGAGDEESRIRGQDPSNPSVSSVGLAARPVTRSAGGGSEEPLVSSQTTSDAANSFSRLVQATQQQTNQPVLTGGITVEQLVTDVAKSMVKTWLEQNLSPIVEAMVAKEIERISGVRD